MKQQTNSGAVEATKVDQDLLLSDTRTEAINAYKLRFGEQVKSIEIEALIFGLHRGFDAGTRYQPSVSTSTREVREAAQMRKFKDIAMERLLERFTGIWTEREHDIAIAALGLAIPTAVTKPTITREEMVEKAREILAKAINEIDWDIASKRSLYLERVVYIMADFALEHASTPLDASPWVAVEHGLPEFDGFYLCQIRREEECGAIKYYPRVVYCDNNAWTLIGLADTVVEWMPIPPHQPADRTDEGGRE